MKVAEVVVVFFAGLLLHHGLCAAGREPDSAGCWVVWSEHPAVSWEHAFVTGNGRVGMMVPGHPGEERITCVQEELFIRAWDRHLVTVPVTASLMPEVRRLVEAGKTDEASRLLTQEASRQLEAMGAANRWPLMPHPAFDLHTRELEGPGPHEVKSYRRQLNLKTGEALVHWITTGSERGQCVFSSRKDNVNVGRLKAGKGERLNVVLSLEETPGRSGWHFDHHLDSAFRLVESAATAGWLTYRAAYAKDAGGYEGVARVTLKGGRMQLELGCEEEWKTTSVEKMLPAIGRQGMSALCMEQLQAMGRYLLISSCGKYPPPLQGIWGGGWRPAWIGGFVWDSNINLAVSAASMSNLPECAASYNRYVLSLLPGWRLNARNYLGCRGFIVAHYNDPENGWLAHFGASFPWMFWAGWNIRPLYEYALMTGDTHFLKEVVLPLYREMGEFYEDNLVTGDDGLYHICPSISPENAPSGTDTWLSRDATMDMAIAREVFRLLCWMGRQFKLTAGERDKWADYLSKLPGYRINADGALAEWVDRSYPDVYEHRHNSHLYPVFPGTELRCPADTALARAVGVALNKRFEFNTSSAHGLIHLALQAARLKDMAKVRQNLDRLGRRGYLYESLVTSHEPGQQIYNLDAVLSFPRLLLEMLVFTEPGRMELLPAWPAAYPDGSVRGVRLYGAHTLDLCWEDGKAVEAALVAGSDEELEANCNGEKRILKLKKGKKYVLIADR